MVGGRWWDENEINETLRGFLHDVNTFLIFWSRMRIRAGNMQSF